MRVGRALFSLTDKRGALPFAAALAARGVEILSTGNTARVLREGGVPVKDVSEHTGFPEMLDGRVKTLHPRIHGGLLGRRDLEPHRRQMEEHGILPIDLVAVNLYPFEEVAGQAGVDLETVIENIDIGGPSMIRSAAKNHRDVAVLVDPADYEAVLAELEANDLSLAPETLRRLALKAFQRTAAYDRAIAAHLGARAEFGGAAAAEQEGELDLSFLEVAAPRALRYGENPHQRSAFLPLRRATAPSVATAVQRNGKELSYNNIVDCDAAFELVKELAAPAAVVVKHTNPCGAAAGEQLAEACAKAMAGDPLSAFGGILAFNRPVDVESAELITAPDRFFECIIAPGFDAEAFELLTTRPKWGKSVRLLEAGEGPEDEWELELRKVRGGVLVQTRDDGGRDEPFETVTRRGIEDQRLKDLRLAWLCAKHVKSNAIVLVKDGALVGTGAGQMSRVDSVEIAVRKAGERAKGSVLGSDAFFPFRDGIDAAARAGVVAVVQPGGSVRDAEVIRAADEHGMAMAFTGRRHFRH